jgi:hypothetical protein
MWKAEKTVTLDINHIDADRLIRISWALQEPLPRAWLLSVPELAQDLQALFRADFIGGCGVLQLPPVPAARWKIGR